MLVADAGHNPAEHPLGRGQAAPAQSPSRPSAETHPAPAETTAPSETLGTRAEPGSGESAARLASEKRNGERVFGVDIESIPLVIAAVIVSVLLVLGLWLTDSVLVPLSVVGFELVAAVFDTREVFHQLDESRTTLVVIAAAVAVMHTLAPGGAGLLARRADWSTASLGACTDAHNTLCCCE